MSIAYVQMFTYKFLLHSSDFFFFVFFLFSVQHLWLNKHLYKQLSVRKEYKNALYNETDPDIYVHSLDIHFNRTLFWATNNIFNCNKLHQFTFGFLSHTSTGTKSCSNILCHKTKINISHRFTMVTVIELKSNRRCNNNDNLLVCQSFDLFQSHQIQIIFIIFGFRNSNLSPESIKSACQRLRHLSKMVVQ